MNEHDDRYGGKEERISYINNLAKELGYRG